MMICLPAKRRLRNGLLAGVAVGLMLAPAAYAQIAAQRAPPPKLITPPPGDDGLAGGGFYLEADELTQDNVTHHVNAKGGVEARYNGRTLRAESVDYDSATGVVVARGKVQIINSDGTAQFADAITLDKDLSNGIALGFSTRLAGDVKIAAASATRVNDQVTELREAIYTPCPVCAETGRAHPTWAIRARKIIEDKKRQIVYYQDAVIEVLGVGVLYLPAFWTADPTADRKSGILPPTLTYSGKRGISLSLPYYQVITKSQDLTIAPQINTKVNPFLNVDWRRRFYSGTLNVRAGFTYDRDFDSSGHKIGDLTTRSYILANGDFAITDKWRWGFTAERASDDLIFDKYDVTDVFKERGLYAADDRRLISQLDVTRQDRLSYLSVAAISVQGLRPDDNDRTFPVVAPLIEGRWEPAAAILGGRLRVDGSAVVLNRDRSPVNPLLKGEDSRRATLQADWRGSFTFGNGLRVEPFAQARGDVYSLNQIPAPGPSSATVKRGFYTVGADVSYPLIKQVGDVTYIVEPLAQLAISPNTKLDPRIPNEDSVVWEFDETNLFQINRSPGFDLYEGGQRVTLGGRATAIFADGRSASVLVGRSFRNGQDMAIPERTGLQHESSDYIVAIEGSPMHGVNLFSRWRLDSGTLAIRRLEAGGDFATSHVNGYLRYLQEDQSPTGGKFKGLDFRGYVWANKNWGSDPLWRARHRPRGLATPGRWRGLQGRLRSAGGRLSPGSDI